MNRLNDQSESDVTPGIGSTPTDVLRVNGAELGSVAESMGRIEDLLGNS
jgi:hypothetical protein